LADAAERDAIAAKASPGLAPRAIDLLLEHFEATLGEGREEIGQVGVGPVRPEEPASPGFQPEGFLAVARAKDWEVFLAPEERCAL